MPNINRSGLQSASERWLMTTRSGQVLSTDHIYRNLTIGLASVLILSPILDSLFSTGKIDAYLTAGFLIFALFELTRRKSDLVIATALGVPAVAGGIFNAATPDSPAANIVPVVLGGAFMAYLIWKILKDIFQGQRISSEQIFGAVCAYLLIGFLFASIYGFIALVDGAAFVINDELAGEIRSLDGSRGNGVFTYFSFVTMSTLGYGDISPVSSAARSFAWIQAVAGQLYLAITIAALVGMHISRNRE
jgi:hypothetical protein